MSSSERAALNATSAAELANDDVIKGMLDDSEVIDAVLGEFYSRLADEDENAFFNDTVANVLSQNFDIQIKAETLTTVGDLLEDIVADEVCSLWHLSAIIVTCHTHHIIDCDCLRNSRLYNSRVDNQLVDILFSTNFNDIWHSGLDCIHIRKFKDQRIGTLLVSSQLFH